MDRGEADDEVLGIITRDEALERAREEGVDLVMIAEKSDPPVCKIVDYGKLRYQKDKKKKEQAKKAKTNEIKEVKMSYKIGEGDYDVRKKRADKFIKNGNRVKLSIQFRGREQQHMSLGDDLIARFIDDLEEAGANIAKTKTIREGRDLTTILSQVGQGKFPRDGGAAMARGCAFFGGCGTTRGSAPCAPSPPPHRLRRPALGVGTMPPTGAGARALPRKAAVLRLFRSTDGSIRPARRSSPSRALASSRPAASLQGCPARDKSAAAVARGGAKLGVSGSSSAATFAPLDDGD